jgi:replicative DNA helicase
MANQEAEQSVLSAMLKSGKAVEIAIERMRPDDFSVPAHQEIFAAMMTLALSGRKLDIVLLDEELTRRGKLDMVGGPAYLVATMSAVPSAVNVDAYIDIVLEKANIRRLQAIAESIKRKCNSGEMTADKIIELIEGACNDITTRTQQRDAGWISGNEAALMAYEAAEKSPHPIATGFAELDDTLCGGWVAPELTIVGARPSKGKSSFLLAAGLKAARDKHHVGYFSLEMSGLQLGQRALATTSLVSITRQRTGSLTDKDWERMNDGLLEIQDSGIGEYLHIYESYGLTVERLANIARHAVRRGEMDLLVLDYIQLLRTAEKTNAEHERLGTISKALKQLALELNIPIVTAAQVRRQSQDDSKKGGRAPTLDELRGSGDLEQDADNVLLIHSPDNPEDPLIKRVSGIHTGIWERAQNACGKPFTVEVAKQRQGANARTWCIFKPMTMRFFDDIYGERA